MKKIMIVLLVCLLLVTGCSGKKEGHKIGITQIADHPALNACREGFISELEKLGVESDIEYKNANGDFNASVSIASNFKEGKELVFAISTTSAQHLKGEGVTTPVLFSAVTDPVQAALVESLEKPAGNFSGTVDAVPVEKQLAIFGKIDPKIKKVGVLFNTSEVNSQVQVKQTKEKAKDFNLEIVDVGITSVNDIPQAMDSMLSKVDAVYVITDNMVASAVGLVADKANEAGIVTVGAERAHVEQGILITDGLSYEELGRQTARMAKRLLEDKENISEMPVESLTKTEKVINQKTAEKLSIELPKELMEDAELIEGESK